MSDDLIFLELLYLITCRLRVGRPTGKPDHSQQGMFWFYVVFIGDIVRVA